jgi:hypothetical protein
VTLGITREGWTPLTVTSATGRVAVSTSAARASRSGMVEAAVTAATPLVVWLTPLRVGPQLGPADTLTVTTPDTALEIEMSIAPSGGRWVRPA